MSSGCQITDQLAPYFCTFTTVKWVDIFSRQVYRDILVDSFNHCIGKKGLQVHGYVFMTNHVHSILSAPEGNLSGILRDMKGFTSKKIFDQIQAGPESRSDWLARILTYEAMSHSRNKRFQVWQHDNHPEILLTQKFFEQKLKYIHMNPVRAGLVMEPERWLYSSAADYCAGKQVGRIATSLLEL